jgi:hypothetical protein
MPSGYPNTTPPYHDSGPHGWWGWDGWAFFLVVVLVGGAIMKWLGWI